MKKCKEYIQIIHTYVHAQRVCPYQHEEAVLEVGRVGGAAQDEGRLRVLLHRQCADVLPHLIQYSEPTGVRWTVTPPYHAPPDKLSSSRPCLAGKHLTYHLPPLEGVGVLLGLDRDVLGSAEHWSQGAATSKDKTNTQDGEADRKEHARYPDPVCKHSSQALALTSGRREPK